MPMVLSFAGSTNVHKYSSYLLSQLRSLRRRCLSASVHYNHDQSTYQMDPDDVLVCSNAISTDGSHGISEGWPCVIQVKLAWLFCFGQHQ